MAGSDECGWLRADDACATRGRTKMKDAAPRGDPATFEIVKNGLYKIAEEMRVVLAKTAYSPLLKSAGDYSCGSHLPDVNVVRPAFYEGRLLGYACLRAHWPDVGSATPGSYGAVTEIF